MNWLWWTMRALFAFGLITALISKQWASIPWILTAAVHCELNRRRTHGHRKDSQDDSGRARAVPAGPSGERPRGAEPEGSASPSGGEVIGWRAWSIANGKLVSPVKGVAWDGPTLRTDVLPTEENSSGIYAVTTLESLGQYSGSGAYGEVALSGRVVCGQHGYRAEQATIRSLYLTASIVESGGDGVMPPGTWTVTPDADTIARLEDAYQVTVTLVPLPDAPSVAIGQFGYAYPLEYYAMLQANRERYRQLAPQEPVPSGARPSAGETPT